MAELVRILEKVTFDRYSSIIQDQQLESKIQHQKEIFPCQRISSIQNHHIIIEMSQVEMIKFMKTQGAKQAIELAYEPSKSIGEYAADIAELFDVEDVDVKLVHKGKILNWKVTAQAANIKEGTVMVVLNINKKEPKKVIASKDQVVQGAGMSTGLGSSSPFGVGGYEAVNHPQYMSAISSAVDPDKMQQIMQDPQYQGMMQQLLDDPDTLRQVMEENPMIRNMIKDNPMMKSMLSNPQMLKLIFNKETMKKTQQYLKNGGTVPQMPSYPSQNMASQPNLFQNQQSAAGMPAMPNMPFYNPYGMGGLGSNPLLAQYNAQMQQSLDEHKYKNELKQLQLMGFKDKTKNIQILKLVNGDIDSAIEKLCSQ